MEKLNKKDSDMNAVLGEAITAIENDEHYILITKNKVHTSFSGLDDSFIKDMSDVFIKHGAFFNNSKVSH